MQSGPGVDSARTDATTLDAVDGVDILDALSSPSASPAPGASPTAPAPTPTPTPPAALPATVAPTHNATALLPRVRTGRLTRRRGRLVATLVLTCPSTAEGACASTLRLQTAAGKRLGATKRIIVSGATGHVRIVLPQAAARLARHGRLAARVRIATTDAAGHAADGTVAVRLRL